MKSPRSRLILRSRRARLPALLLAAALAAPAATQELGRLFFTPERRQALDRQR